MASQPGSRATLIAAGAFALFVAIAVTGIALALSEPHWSYEGDTGPEHWGDLSPEYADCATGERQSPIDIPRSAPLLTTGLRFDYRAEPLTIVNNGHTVQVNSDGGSTISLHGEVYTLAQFHFHAPSEHTLEGEYTDLEMHLVHRNAAGALAVVGVFIVEGSANPAFDAVWSNLPAEEGEPQRVENATVDVAALLPSERGYHRYDGSLTTPPCTEGVTWLLLPERVEMSGGQITAFEAIHDDNHRPVQPLNDRAFAEEASDQPAQLAEEGRDSWLIAGLVIIGIGGAAMVAYFYTRARRK